MKRLVLLIAMSALLVATLGTGAAIAQLEEDVWDGNARGEFATVGSRNNVWADGYIILNYVKGKNAYNVSGAVTDVDPGTYTVSVGTGGTCADNVEIVTFTVGADGYGEFAAQHVESWSYTATFDIVRIYAEGDACNSQLVARANPYTNPVSGIVSELNFRDGSRVTGGAGF